MGMFDHVVIALDKLPVTDEERDELKYCDFQTKSFDRQLITYHVDENNRLMRGRTNWLEDDRFNFYTITRADKWFSFNAWVTDGVVTKIERNDHR